jgi:hypothetical protein
MTCRSLADNDDIALGIERHSLQLSAGFRTEQGTFGGFMLKSALALGRFLKQLQRARRRSSSLPILRRLAGFVGQLIRSDGHLGPNLVQDGIDGSSNSEVLRAACSQAREMGRHDLGECIDGCIHSLFGNQGSSTFANAQLQKLGFCSNEISISLRSCRAPRRIAQPI